MTATDDRLDPDIGTVRALIETQFPQWQDELLAPLRPGGWDNRTFRLGPDKLVRLPSAERYARQPLIEAHWLPRLAPFLPVPIPRLLGLGTPGPLFPFNWTVLGWHEGETATFPGSPGLARDLAGFLTALWQIDATQIPPAGPTNFHRGGDLAIYEPEARAAFERLPGAQALNALFDRALASRRAAPPVAVHGDIAPGNLILRNSRLAAVIDWGCLGAGDSACDLTIAWTLFQGPARTAFRDALATDPDTWARARGWAAWKAAITLRDTPADTPAARVIADVTEDIRENAT